MIAQALLDLIPQVLGHDRRMLAFVKLTLMRDTADVNRVRQDLVDMPPAEQAGLSRYHSTGAKFRRLRNCQAAATAVRHASIAVARSARCVWAEVRWRWTLKVL